MSSPRNPSSAPPVPSPSNPVLLATQSQWIFTNAELYRTPSVLDGMDIETEHLQRSKGVNFISQVGVLLKLPQLTLSTASVYLHRFFMRYSMVDLPNRPGMHPYSIAATALFLATKVEENCRKMRELIVACCRVALKKPNVIIDEQSKEFWKWRDTILHNEDLLLEALCFDLQLEQPYRLLFDFLCYFHVQDNKRIRNAAWAFVNDSTFSVICLQFNSRIIAAAALYAAARHCNASFEDDCLGRPWWEQIDVDVAEIRRACNRMAELYEKYPLPARGLKYPASPMGSEGESSAEKMRQTNRRAAETTSQSPTESNGRKRERETGELSDTSTPPDTHPATNGADLPRSAVPESDRSPKRQRRETSEAASDPNFSASFSQTQPPLSSQASFVQATSALNLASTQSSQTEGGDDRHRPSHPPPSAGDHHHRENPSTADPNRTSTRLPRPPASSEPRTNPNSRIPAVAQQRMQHPLPPPPPPPGEPPRG